jgi:hypothetical protein
VGDTRRTGWGCDHGGAGHRGSVERGTKDGDTAEIAASRVGVEQRASRAGAEAGHGVAGCPH